MDSEKCGCHCPSQPARGLGPHAGKMNITSIEDMSSTQIQNCQCRPQQLFPCLLIFRWHACSLPMVDFLYFKKGDFLSQVDHHPKRGDSCRCFHEALQCRPTNERLIAIHKARFSEHWLELTGKGVGLNEVFLAFFLELMLACHCPLQHHHRLLVCHNWWSPGGVAAWGLHHCWLPQAHAAGLLS